MNVETIDVAVERLIKSVLGADHGLHTYIAKSPNLNNLKGEIEYLFNVQITGHVHTGADIVNILRGRA